jgi:AcrR family transcriptional regulator
MTARRQDRYGAASRSRGKGPGRRVGTTGASRKEILKAARGLFAELGFRGTTMRAIANRAGVDVALVHYFFESKAKLFAVVIELPIVPERLTELLSAGKGQPGERMARYYLAHLLPERRDAITAMLRAGIGDPDCIPALRTLIEQTLVAGAARALRSKDARLRAELAGAQMIGLFITRCIVGVEPLATASVDQIVKVLGPALNALLRPSKEEQQG